MALLLFILLQTDLMGDLILADKSLNKENLIDSNKVNYDSLYDYANTLLVKFNTQKDSARKTFIKSGPEGIQFLVRKFDTRHASEMSTLEEILKRMGRPAIDGILKNIGYRGSDEEARCLRLSLRIVSETFKYDTTLVGDDVVPQIAKYVQDSDWRVRGGTATALGYSQSRKAFPHLLILIKDTINVVRKSAAYSIKNIAQPEDISILFNLLSDEYYGVCFAAQEGLIKIGPKAVMPIAVRLENTNEPKIKSLLIKSLGGIKNRKADKIIESYHQDPSPLVRLAVYESTSDKKILRKFFKTESDTLLKNTLRIKIIQ